MAESLLFESAGQILGKLTTLAIREIGLIFGVKSDLKKLELSVSSIQSILLDAAEQKKQHRHVEDWLEKLQDILYDISDLLDDFMTEELRRTVVIKRSKQKAIRNFFSSSNSLAIRVKLSHKLQKIRRRLEDIDADSKRFEFVKRILDKPIAYPEREQTHAFVQASEVIGRDADKNIIIDLLLSSSSSSGSGTNISVLPIVGIGGIGKTTLAKLVYNDETIVANFETRLWICVSEEFDLPKLIAKILKDATGGVDHAHLDLNQLQSRLRTSLDSGKFFLVLDDVWNEDRKKWTDLKNLLNCGSHGSKVLITTRKETSARIMGTLGFYQLHYLSNEECMTIFLKCAFNEGEEKLYPGLVEIGKAIVMKCKGLPLAVISVGSLLFIKREEHEWVHIRDTDIWELLQKDNDVLPVLKLSYDEMPIHLKHCFAYCAKFRKDVRISSISLIAEWIAHGFIQSPSDGGIQRLEDIGNQYFQELLSRSFFQIEETFFTNHTIHVKMHDLMHDLALSVAGKMVSHFDDTRITFEGTRHLLFCATAGEELPRCLLKLNKVRSFAFGYQVGSISKIFLESLIEKFKCLRTLSLEGSQFEELPSSVGKLKHLRLLNIRGNKKIKALPNSIGKLVNLKTLHLDGCLMLQCLPRDFGSLWSLRTLYLTSQMKGGFPEKGVAEGLCSLQHLAIVSCYNLESLSEEIKFLTTLRILYIRECSSLTSLPTESMKHLTCLEHLTLWGCKKLNLIEEESKTIQLPRSLLSLALFDMPNLKGLPRGFERASSSIQYIDIYDCYSFETLPDWLKKCASLKKLRLANCSLYLHKKCEKETGEYWHLISHVPSISIFSKVATIQMFSHICF